MAAATRIIGEECEDAAVFKFAAEKEAPASSVSCFIF
jgi:hypothetical protein